MAEAKSTFHLSDVSRGWQPAKRDFFEVTFPDGLQLRFPGVSAEEDDENSFIPNVQEALKLAVEKFDPPSYELEDITIEKGNSVVHYAGKAKYSSSTLEVKDWIGPYTRAILQAWHALAYDYNSDKGGRARNYKLKLVITEYTADFVEVASWDLIGCWCQKLDLGTYDRTNDEAVNVTATIIYDRAIPHVKDVSEEFPYAIN